MKGRLTSLNVNFVIDGINIALESKYEILKKPRNSLKKKDQDMYNTWKIQQNTMGQGENRMKIVQIMHNKLNIYFFVIFRTVFCDC